LSRKSLSIIVDYYINQWYNVYKGGGHMPTYLTIEDVAELFKINRSTVYLWMERGMPSRKIGKTRRFIKEEIEEWFDNQGLIS